MFLLIFLSFFLIHILIFYYLTRICLTKLFFCGGLTLKNTTVNLQVVWGKCLTFSVEKNKNRFEMVPLLQEVSIWFGHNGQIELLAANVLH